MCCVIPPNSFSATFDLRIASRREVLPWSTWPMTVTTGGRSLSCAGSRSSSSTTSPSTERISTSTLNLSATSLAAVGSRSSLTVAITPSSSSALITSPDLRRIFSASSPTVTDSGTRMGSRLTSTGGAVGSSTTAGATAAGSTGTGGAGTGGARGAAGTAARLTIGAVGWGAGRGGGAGAAGRDGDMVTRGGANGPAGCRDGRGEGAGAPRSRGRNGTILGSGFFGAAGPGGGAIGATDGFGAIGSGGGATTVGSGTISGSGVGTNGGSGATSVAGPTGFGFTIVAAGLTSVGRSSSVFVFLDREAGFFASASPTVAASAASSATLGFGTRLGFGASGRSRPFPSFTRSAFASVLSRGLMARMPLWPISSAATIKSLLVTPSSLASSITFILAAATVPSPPYRSHRDHMDVADRTPGYLAELRVFGLSRRRRNGLTPTRGPYRCRQGRMGFAGLLERVAEPTPAQRALDARGVGAHVRAPSGGPRPGVRDDRSVRQSHEPHEHGLRPSPPASQTRAGRWCLHAGV